MKLTIGRMTDQSSSAEVLRFWFGPPEERGRRHKRWFVKNAAFDREIRERFLPLYEQAAGGKLAHLKENAADSLALILLLDQVPRNMFRGTPRAFASDALALEAARHAVHAGFDRSMLAVERMFTYLPFEHSEVLADQELACELTKPLDVIEPELDAHRYAVLHRDIIQRFGRFPHRNAILGRTSTPEELEFLKGPGSSF
jgi:uncharacterized protein (DUF924 family)